MHGDKLMDIHKPKPWHGWREFLKELGTIALGVGIALAAEQGVEWLHWRGQVQQAREVIATEFTTNLVGAINRLNTAACVERRLDQLAQIVDEAAKKGNLPPLGDISTTARAVWPTGAWESVVASQTATHFPRQQLAYITSLNKFLERLQENNSAELEAWSQLHSMTGPGRHLDPASESELRKALSSARTLDNVYVSLSLQLGDRVKSLQLPFSQSDLDALKAARSRLPASFPICQPIGAPTAFYGQGYKASTVLSDGRRYTTENAAKAIPDFAVSAK